MKIAKFEKQLVKGLISMDLEKGIELNASKLENELRRITGESDGEHRYKVEEYIEKEIEKVEK